MSGGVEMRTVRTVARCGALLGLLAALGCEGRAAERAGRPLVGRATLPAVSDAGSELRAGSACGADADCPGGQCRIEREGAPGYCTWACEASANCGEAGVCRAVLGSTTQAKECLAECTLDGDCREDFVCTGATRINRFTISGGCRPTRPVGQLGDRVAGRACEANAECSGGHCASANLLGLPYPGNYCTGRCYEDAHCGEGGVCLWPRGSIDPGHCLQRCDAHVDCAREGYRCWQLGDGARVIEACYPGSEPLQTTGQACSEDSACGAAPARCARELPYAGLITNDLTPARDGYCTQACGLDSECGRDAFCINYGTSGGICLSSCSQAAPCRSGYECAPHQRDGDPEDKACVPETPGVGADADGGA